LANTTKRLLGCSILGGYALSLVIEPAVKWPEWKF